MLALYATARADGSLMDPLTLLTLAGMHGHVSKLSKAKYPERTISLTGIALSKKNNLFTHF